jgi:hypothetical protein
MHQRREQTIEIIKQRLVRSGAPRFLVSLILVLTGFAGFIVSFSLLHLGVSWMWLRYPVAILAAYCVFLLLLRVWLFFQRPRKLDVDMDSGLEVADAVISEAPGQVSGFEFGGGGDFDGGGAGVSWGERIAPSSSSVSSSSSSSGGIGFDLDLEEGWWIIIAIIALLGGLIAILYVVYVAPALLAEILVDGVLVGGLYKQLKDVEQRYWLRAAVRRTLLPALLAAIFFSVAGYAMQNAAPRARSIGEVWKHLAKD